MATYVIPTQMFVDVPAEGHVPQMTIILTARPSYEGTSVWPGLNGRQIERKDWQVRITCDGPGHHGEGVFPFHQGMAHENPPTVADLMQCLTADASYIETPEDLDEVLHGMPYSEARKTHDAIVEQNVKLRDLLGPFYYRAMALDPEVWETTEN